MTFVRQRILHYIDKKNRKNRFLKKKDEIYLLRRNICIKKSNDKFDWKKYGFFLIKKKRMDIMYKFVLFQKIRLYSIFYISLLKSISLQTFLQINLEIKENETKYKIEKILDYQRSFRRKEYFIK